MKKIKIIIKALQILSLTAFFSCGGTWENNDDIWARTFNEEKPEEIELVNSKIWVSSHWTYEFQSFLEIKSNEKWLNEFEKEHKLINSSDFEIIEITEKPSWFAPKTKDNYTIKESDFFQDFKVLIDKDTKNIFITCSQL